jgi:hypothetical protein
MNDKELYERYLSRHAHQLPEWGEIERHVFGRCDDDAPSGLAERTFSHSEMVSTLAEIVRWTVFGAARQRETDVSQTRALRIRVDTIGARAIVAAWILRPEMFDGLPLATIGELPNEKASRKVLCDHAADFEGTFGIRSQAQRTQTNRDQLSESARKRWKRKQSAPR